MTHVDTKILRLDRKQTIEDDHLVEFKNLAREWEATSEFWTVESCLTTVRSHPGVLSAAIVGEIDRLWYGWYLATTQNDQAELLFIYTRESARKKGLARLMLEDLIHQVKSLGTIKSIFLEVRPSNTFARCLYTSLGFVEIAKRGRYYSDGEDAIVYEYAFDKK